MEREEVIQRSLQDLAAGLAESRQAPLPDLQEFLPLEADEIAQDLNLYVRAAAAGQHGEPSLDADAPDLYETEIGTAIERRLHDAHTAYREQLAKHDAQVERSFLSEPERLEIEATVQGVRFDLETQIRQNLARLREFYREHVERIEAEFEAFQIDHELIDPPKLVSRGEKLVRSVILMVCVIAGTVLDGRVLAVRGGTSLGWTLQAFLWSLLNVGVAVWYGRDGLARLVSRGLGAKLLGMISTGAFLACMLATNVLAAHLRDVFVVHNGSVSIPDVWHRLVTAPFALVEFKSWLVGAAGVAASIVAVIIAAGMDELYPGYGDVGRRRIAELEAYDSESSSCFATLNTIRDAALQEVGSPIEVMQRLEQAGLDALEARKRFHAAFLQYLDGSAAVHAQLCRRYREINAAVRGGQVPRYFAGEVQRPACLRHTDLPEQRGLPRYSWPQAIERLEQHARTVAALFEAATEPAPAAPQLFRDPVEAETETEAEVYV